MWGETPIKKRRGRPYGHRLSEESKERIRRSRTGRRHCQETKDKISRSLSSYFKGRDSLSMSMEYEYSEMSPEAIDWICDNREFIDDSEFIMTEKRLMYLKQLEICMGNELEQIFGHNKTPEFLLLLKEDLSAIDPELVKELLSLL
jgi:hypothetical protein